MKSTIYFFVTLICLGKAQAQTHIHIYFNITNCQAHSTQISQLSLLDNSISKFIHLSKQDSAITPWILDYFSLIGLNKLDFIYHSHSDLVKYFGKMGQSMVVVSCQKDTISTFEIESLPSEIDAINSLTQSDRHSCHNKNKVQIEAYRDDTLQPTVKSNLLTNQQINHRQSELMNYTIYELENKEKLKLSSDVQIMGRLNNLWLLDKFMGKLYQIILNEGSRFEMNEKSELKKHFFTSSNIDSSISKFSNHKHDLNIEMISHLDNENNPVLLMNLTIPTDSTKNINSNMFYRFLMTVEASSTSIEKINTAGSDSISPFIGASGFTWVGDTMIAQVMSDRTDESFSPLFGYFKTENNSIKLDSPTSYNYRTDVWRKIGKYHFVNGNFTNSYFGFCVAPIVVDLHSWKEHDLSNQLNVTLDSAIRMVPGHFYAIDIESDNQGIGMLCMIKSKLYLIQFSKSADSLQIKNIIFIDTKDFTVSEASLIDRYSFIFTNPSKDKLLLGTMIKQ